MQQRCRNIRTDVCVVAPSLRHDQIRDRIAVVRDGRRAFLTSPWRGEERRIFGPMSCFPCLPSYPLWRPRKKANKIGRLTPAYPSLKSKMHMISHAHLKDNLGESSGLISQSLCPAYYPNKIFWTGIKIEREAPEHP